LITVFVFLLGLPHESVMKEKKGVTPRRPRAEVGVGELLFSAFSFWPQLQPPRKSTWNRLLALAPVPHD